MIFENVSQKAKGELSFVHNAVISFQAEIKHVLEIYQTFFRYISDIGHIEGIFLAFFRHIMGMGITQIFRYLLTCDKISVNSISFNI